MKLLANPGVLALSPARLGQIAAAVASQPDGWSDVLRFDAGRRWYRRLELADDYEVWLLTWLPGQSTGFHDHGHAAGAFAVARGQVSERTVAVTGPPVRTAAGTEPPVRAVAVTGPQIRHRTVSAGSFGSEHVHDVINDFGAPAVSVHAYSPPLTAMRRYDLTQTGLVPVATQSAEQGW